MLTAASRLALPTFGLLLEAPLGFFRSVFLDQLLGELSVSLDVLTEPVGRAAVLA